MCKFSIKRACTCLFFLLSATSLNAQTSIDGYIVTGSNFDELITSIDKNGPSGAWGRTNHDWAVSYTMAVQGNKHKVIKVNVAHAVRIEMPVWRGYTRATACMKSSWDSMYLKLKKHEDTHAELGDGVAEKIRQTLLSIPPQNSKDELELLVNQKTNTVLRENQAIQGKFDADTDHGKNAGSDSIVLKQC